MTKLWGEDPAPARKRWWRRWRWRIAGVVLVAFGLPAVYFFLASSEIDRRMAEIRARGEPISLDELETYYKGPLADQDATQLWLGGGKLLAASTKSRDVKILPFVGEAKDPPPLGQPWPEIDLSRQFLQANAEGLRQLHAAADLGGQARYPLCLANMSNTQLLRNAAQCLNLEAHVHAHDGDLHGAAESIRTRLLLSQSFANGPNTIDQLHRIALHDAAINTLKRIGAANLPESDLRRLQATFSQIEFNTAVQRVAIGERAYGLSVFDDPDSVGSLRHVYPLWRSADLTMFLRITAELVEACELPWLARAREMEEWDTRNQRRVTRLHNLTKLLTPMFPLIHTILARSETENRLAMIDVAIARYSRQHDRAPENLSALVPEFLADVPLDPVAAAPFQYRATDDGYILYSPINARVSVSVQKPDVETGADPRLVFRWPPLPEEPADAAGASDGGAEQAVNPESDSSTNKDCSSRGSRR